MTDINSSQEEISSEEGQEESINPRERKNFSIECKLKTDTEEVCVPCEIANAIVAFSAIEDAHPGEIDTSIIDKEMEKGTSSVEQWLEIIEQMKAEARGAAATEAELVTEHLYQIVCEPKQDG